MTGVNISTAGRTQSPLGISYDAADGNVVLVIQFVAYSLVSRHPAELIEPTEWLDSARRKAMPAIHYSTPRNVNDKIGML